MHAVAVWGSISDEDVRVLICGKMVPLMPFDRRLASGPIEKSEERSELVSNKQLEATILSYFHTTF